MIKIENVEVVGWGHSIRGMRNPMNSWDKSDSKVVEENCENCMFKADYSMCKHNPIHKCFNFNVGPNDHKLMTNLKSAGSDHRKYLRYLVVYLDITAPLYWWKEFKTYRHGRKFMDDGDMFEYDDDMLEYHIETNSCSTMHKIHEKEFTLEDFSCEHLDVRSRVILETIIEALNKYRDLFVNYNADDYEIKGCPSKKTYWWQIIQLLPTSYNQKRTVMLNYEVLVNMYRSRKTHKLDEWRDFCKWVESLPYSELITGERKEKEDK